MFHMINSYLPATKYRIQKITLVCAAVLTFFFYLLSVKHTDNCLTGKSTVCFKRNDEVFTAEKGNVSQPNHQLYIYV